MTYFLLILSIKDSDYQSLNSPPYMVTKRATDAVYWWNALP
ncbi:hypothetical protein SynROS8604_02557 [Synechococcus sp. ROS8604]|nr:hypothetical protein SynROS8604_02557 [Synechococcus sp. ROS8604]